MDPGAGCTILMVGGVVSMLKLTETEAVVELPAWSLMVATMVFAPCDKPGAVPVAPLAVLVNAEVMSTPLLVTLSDPRLSAKLSLYASTICGVLVFRKL